MDGCDRINLALGYGMGLKKLIELIKKDGLLIPMYRGVVNGWEELNPNWDRTRLYQTLIKEGAD